MSISTAAVATALDGLRPFEGTDACALSAAELLAAQEAAARLRRAAEAVLAGLAFEVGRRSTADAGAGGLARSQGFASPGRLVAAAAGGSLGDALRLMEAGAVLVADGGAGASPTSTALASGDIGAEKASLLHKTLTALGERAPEFEVRLLERARNSSLEILKRACAFALASADPHAWAEREDRQVAARCVTVSDDSEGMVVITARLDPPSAAPVVAWLDAQVKDAMRRRRDGDPLAEDRRTVGQIRADALVGLARHGLVCSEPTSGVSTTVVVRMTLEQLRVELGSAGNEGSGDVAAVGVGSCDDVRAPLTAGALRRLAVDAEVIPAVLGAESEVLDFGRARRLFSRAQRLALVERDGGCAMCHAPPSYTEAHHIRWWDRDTGPTDLSNGVLLCTGCHHRVHRDGWEIEATASEVWVTPPASVDPARVRRLGGAGRVRAAA